MNPVQAVKNIANNLAKNVERAIENLTKSTTPTRLEVGTATQLAKTQQVGMVGSFVASTKAAIAEAVNSLRNLGKREQTQAEALTTQEGTAKEPSLSRFNALFGAAVATVTAYVGTILASVTSKTIDAKDTPLYTIETAVKGAVEASTEAQGINDISKATSKIKAVSYGLMQISQKTENDAVKSAADKALSALSSQADALSQKAQALGSPELSQKAQEIASAIKSQAATAIAKAGTPELQIKVEAQAVRIPATASPKGAAAVTPAVITPNVSSTEVSTTRQQLSPKALSEFGSLDAKAFENRLTNLAKPSSATTHSAELLGDIKANIAEVDHASSAILEDMKSHPDNSPQNANLRDKLNTLSQVRTLLSSKLDVITEEALSQLEKFNPMFKILRQGSQGQDVLGTTIPEIYAQGREIFSDSANLKDETTRHAFILLAQAVLIKSNGKVNIYASIEETDTNIPKEDIDHMRRIGMKVMPMAQCEAEANKLAKEGKQVALLVNKASKGAFSGVAQNENVKRIEVDEKNGLASALVSAGLIRDAEFLDLFLKRGGSMKELKGIEKGGLGSISVTATPVSEDDMNNLQNQINILYKAT